MEQRIVKLETEVEDLRLEVNKTLIMRENCPLGAYKEEMKQRCQRFTDKIDTNKENINNLKDSTKDQIAALEKVVAEKIKANRAIIGRLISSLIVLGVCLTTIIGSLQATKVSVSEYTKHIENSRAERMIERDNFNKFLTRYSADELRHNGKIDKMFDAQLEFNISIMKQNGLLQQQLEVIKVKLKIDGNK